MEKHTPIQKVLGAVILLVIFGFIAYTFSVKKDSVDEVSLDPQEVTYCYYEEITGVNGLKDVNYLKVIIDEGKVEGELGTIPAEKDKMIGTLSGMMTPPNVIDALYSYSAEGIDAVEERVIKLDATQALVGYGEMVDQGDGVFVYKDKTNIPFFLPIPKIDCGEYEILRNTR